MESNQNKDDFDIEKIQDSINQIVANLREQDDMEQEAENLSNSGFCSILPTRVMFAIGISAVAVGLFTGYTVGMLYKIDKKIDQIYAATITKY